MNLGRGYMGNNSSITPAYINTGSYYIKVFGDALTPNRVGDIVRVDMSADEDWIPCNGSCLQKKDYPYLFSVIGYKFGGSGGTFKLPDFRDGVQWEPNSINIGGMPITALK